MYTPNFPKGCAAVMPISKPLSTAEYINVEPNTKYKLEFDIKSDGVWTSQPLVNLILDGSAIQFSQTLASPKEWTHIAMIILQLLRLKS